MQSPTLPECLLEGDVLASTDVPGDGDSAVAAQPRPAAADLAGSPQSAGVHPGARSAGGRQAGGLPHRRARCAGPAARLPAPAALQGGQEIAMPPNTLKSCIMTSACSSSVCLSKGALKGVTFPRVDLALLGRMLAHTWGVT